MSKIYLAYNFCIEPKDIGSEILIAELENTPFESFEDTENGIIAYIQKDLCMPETVLKDIEILTSENFKISYEIQEIEPINWNKEWEENFKPISVDDTCVVRAPFHPTENVTYEIVIEPKMSFGTGHHETTFMMIQHILENEFTNKSVLDMGCGTSVLAILAEMKGAKPIDAIDIDEWCVENSIENIERNFCKNITVYQGDASLLNHKKYDCIIANINRNILLNDIQAYATCLPLDGDLFLSGFYTEDIPVIEECCNKNSLKFISKKEKNNWVALHFKKN